MSEKEQKQWYVIRAIGGKEKKVKEYIESEIRHSHLEDYISQVLIPTEKVYSIRNGKKNQQGTCFVPWICIGGSGFRRRNSVCSSQRT